MNSVLVRWVFLPLFVLAVGYSLVGIFSFKSMYHSANTPKAEFLLSGNAESQTNFIIFTTYSCGFCKELYPVIKELKEVRKDIRFITHPIGFYEGETRRLVGVSIAAGLQGKFSEMHEALMEYPLSEEEQTISEDFINETAALYGMDIEKFSEDRASANVQKIIDKANSALDNAGITSVPSFMINDKIYVVTNDSLPELKDLLDIVTQAEK